MKRILLLLCLAALLLTGCGSRETEFTVEKGGVTYTVNTEAGTISGGGYNCRYTIADDKESVTVRFPDGKTWTKYKNEGSSSMNGFGTNNFALIKAAGDMTDILLDLTDSGPNWRSLVISVLSFGLGLGMILKPYAFWKIKWGWRFQDAAPSGMALRSIQFTGAILMLVCVLLFFVSLF